GTCWSSANPIRSAIGSVAKRRSASSFPVKCRASGTALMLVDHLLPAGKLAVLARGADSVAPVGVQVEERLQQLAGPIRVAVLRRLLGGDPDLVLLPQVVAPVGAVVLLDVEQPPELSQRILVVVDPEVRDAALPREARRLALDDEDRRRLNPTEVPALRLGGVQRGEQAACERALRGLVRGCHRVPDRVPGHTVRLTGEAVAGEVPGGPDVVCAS